MKKKRNKERKRSLVLITANDLCVIFSLSFFKYSISQSRFLNILNSEKVNRKKVKKKIFRAVLPHPVQFRFEAPYKSTLDSVNLHASSTLPILHIFN